MLVLLAVVVLSNVASFFIGRKQGRSQALAVIREEHFRMCHYGVHSLTTNDLIAIIESRLDGMPIDGDQIWRDRAKRLERADKVERFPS